MILQIFKTHDKIRMRNTFGEHRNDELRTAMTLDGPPEPSVLL